MTRSAFHHGRLSDRRGLREISGAPSVAQLAHFVRRKEMQMALWATAPKDREIFWWYMDIRFVNIYIYTCIWYNIYIYTLYNRYLIYINGHSLIPTIMGWSHFNGWVNLWIHWIHPRPKKCGVWVKPLNHSAVDYKYIYYKHQSLT